MRKLNRASIANQIDRPVKVLQFGEGNFLRAFADWMIDILNEKTNFNSSVQIVQPLPAGMAEQLNSQDGLYHVVLNGIQQGKQVNETRLITCVQSVVNPYKEFGQFLKLAENPHLKFVISNTTESGITFSDRDTDVNVISDSFPGKLTSLLFHRYQYFKAAEDKGLIFLPCELIEKNGEALEKCILQYALLWKLPTAFSEWIRNNNIFCNTLVDRIVPGFPKDNIKEIQGNIGFGDNMVVKAEAFHLWVIETDAKIKDQLPFEEAGLQVKFVNDLTPYRSRKVRILNGAHTAMVPVAYLKGLRTVQEAVDDNEVGKFVRDLIYKEVIPTLDLPEQELKQFAADVIERFQNPFIRHELISIALNSISKFKVRVLPTILEYQKRKGVLPPLLVESLANLIVFYKGEVKGETIPLNDSPDVLSFFREAWTKSPEEVVALVLSNKSFWDRDLTEITGLRDGVLNRVSDLVGEKVGSKE